MVSSLYSMRNERKVSFFYPVNGRKNILRSVNGVKIRSYTGPNGRGITVREANGQLKSFSVNKCVTGL